MTQARALVEVADGVHVAVSSVYATTTTVVERDGRCLVVDPAVTAREVVALDAALRARGWRPVVVWSTHPHWDHLLDAPGLRDVARWAAAAPADGWRDAATRQRDADPELAAHLAAHPQDAPAAITTRAPAPFPRADEDADGWHRLDWDGPHVRVLTHDAHSAGHTALAVVDAGVLVAGDMLSDVEVPLVDTDRAASVEHHLAVLDRFEAGVRRYGAHRVVPGHGSVGGAGSALARVAADRAYLTGPDGPRDDDPRLGPGTPAWLRAAHREQRAALVTSRTTDG
jgi:glyoxylase-like metal-dependent hydrolase (beta-lactamase superfamily II)